MKKSALVETLRLLRLDEMNRFDKFLRSPFFNEGAFARDCLALWLALRRFTPKFEDALLETEAIYRLTYPDRIFAKGKIEVVAGKLNALLQQFLLQIQTPSFTLPDAVRLATFHRERGNHARAQKLLEKCGTEMDSEPAKNFEHRLARYFLEFEKKLLDGTAGWKTKHRDDSEMKFLFSAFLMQGLREVNRIARLATVKTLDDHFSKTLAERLPELLKWGDFDATDPLLDLLKTMLELRTQPEKYANPADFNRLIEQIEVQAVFIPLELKNSFFAYVQTFCSQQFNVGRTEFAQFNNQLYKTAHRSALLFVSGKMPASRLLNICQIGFFSKDFEWVEQMLVESEGKIVGTDHPTAFTRYLRANLAYHLGQPDQALDLLLENYEDLYGGLMARKLELKIYFETDSPLFEPKLEAFRIFLLRKSQKNGLPSDVVAMNKNFVSCLQQLAAVHFSKEKLTRLREKIDSTQRLAERQWLTERVEFYLKK